MEPYTNPREALQLKLEVATLKKQLIDIQQMYLGLQGKINEGELAKAQQELADFEKLMEEATE